MTENLPVFCTKSGVYLISSIPFCVYSVSLLRSVPIRLTTAREGQRRKKIASDLFTYVKTCFIPFFRTETPTHDEISTVCTVVGVLCTVQYSVQYNKYSRRILTSTVLVQVLQYCTSTVLYLQRSLVHVVCRTFNLRYLHGGGCGDQAKCVFTLVVSKSPCRAQFS